MALWAKVLNALMFVFAFSMLVFSDDMYRSNLRSNIVDLASTRARPNKDQTCCTLAALKVAVKSVCSFLCLLGHSTDASDSVVQRGVQARKQDVGMCAAETLTSLGFWCIVLLVFHCIWSLPSLQRLQRALIRECTRAGTSSTCFGFSVCTSARLQPPPNTYLHQRAAAVVQSLRSICDWTTRQCSAISRPQQDEINAFLFIIRLAPSQSLLVDLRWPTL